MSGTHVPGDRHILTKLYPNILNIQAEKLLIVDPLAKIKQHRTIKINGKQ